MRGLLLLWNSSRESAKARSRTGGNDGADEGTRRPSRSHIGKLGHFGNSHFAIGVVKIAIREPDGLFVDQETSVSNATRRRSPRRFLNRRTLNCPIPLDDQ